MLYRKKSKHKPFGYTIFTNCSFDPTKNKLDSYKGEECMERFCKDLRERAMKIINYVKKKEEMIPLTDKENESCENQKFVTYAKKNVVLMKMNLILMKMIKMLMTTTGNLVVKSKLGT